VPLKTDQVGAEASHGHIKLVGDRRVHAGGHKKRGEISTSRRKKLELTKEGPGGKKGSKAIKEKARRGELSECTGRKTKRSGKYKVRGGGGGYKKKQKPRLQ